MRKHWLLTLIFLSLIFSFAAFVPHGEDNLTQEKWFWDDIDGVENAFKISGNDFFEIKNYDGSFGFGNASNCFQTGTCYQNNWSRCGGNYPCYSQPSCNIANYKLAYQAEFISDINYPDGAYVAPGQKFLKTWRVRNVGYCAWNAGVQLVFYGGDQMGNQSVAIGRSVNPGQTIDISIYLQAPNGNGSFKSNWMLMNEAGQFFGVGCGGQVPLWANISTWRSNNCYCGSLTPCVCPTVGATNPCYGSYCGPQPSNNGRNPYCNNKIRSINDITVRDGTVLKPGEIFRKTWRMKNGGTCVWDQNYLMVFYGGESFSGAKTIRLPKKVAPGETVEISIDLKAPETPGRYQGYYKLQDNLGYQFGFGSYADEAFWVDITVTAPITVITPVAP